jgi:hypothetical protein
LWDEFRKKKSRAKGHKQPSVVPILDKRDPIIRQRHMLAVVVGELKIIIMAPDCAAGE